MANEFEIGTAVDSTVTLASLGVPAPKYEYGLYAGEIVLGDGTSRGVGFPVTVWHWSFITAAQRTALRTYCTGKSAVVFIRTIKDDNTYADFEAIMIWPTHEERSAGRVLDFSLEFRNMVEIVEVEP